MEPLNIPLEADWGNYQADLDQLYAHKTFFDKTIDQVIPDFERNVLEKTAELRFMPTLPFRYYMLAFRDFVLSPRLLEAHNGWDAADAASCFLGLILEKLERTPKTIAPIMPALMPAIHYVATQQTLYQADEDIYGNFLDKLAQIHTLYGKA